MYWFSLPFIALPWPQTLGAETMRVGGPGWMALWSVLAVQEGPARLLSAVPSGMPLSSESLLGDISKFHRGPLEELSHVLV